MLAKKRTTTPADQIGFKIRRVHNLLNQQWASLAHEFELNATPVQSGVILVISDSPGITQKNLAKIMGVDVSTLSLALTPMLENELVRREPAPKDGRVRCHFLTEKGEAAKRKIEDIIAARSIRLPGDLSESEVETLHLLLDKMLCSQ